MNSGIYAIINTENGRHYVGHTGKIYTRFANHVSELKRGKHPNLKLQRSWVKRGQQAFVFVVMEYVAVDSSLLQAKEEFWMNECRARGIDLYNFGLASCPRRGRPLSDEHKRKLSIAKKGKTLSEEHRRAVSVALTGKKKSPEVVEKLRISGRLNGFQKGQVSLTKGCKGLFKMSDEQKKKLSVMMKARCASPEGRARMAELLRIRWQERKGMQRALF